ncbi:hypothetical protein A6C57_25695 [Fibrella sp. ES10-3-2-2]
MNSFQEPESEQPATATFYLLPLLGHTLRNTPDCSLKKCCKKYKKGKRCKSCPDK